MVRCDGKGPSPRRPFPQNLAPLSNLETENESDPSHLVPRATDRRRTPDKPQLRDTLRNARRVLLKATTVIKNKEVLRNCPSPEEPRDT